MTVIDGPTWRLRLVTFIPVPFSPPFLFILALQPILFHTVVKRSFSEKVQQSCLTVVQQMTCQRSHICWCASCRHHVFVLLGTVGKVCFGSFNFAWLRQRLVSPSFKKTTVHINLPEYYFRYSIFFLEIDICVISLCWLYSLSDILAPHDSDRFSRIKYFDYFVCYIMF